MKGCNLDLLTIVNRELGCGKSFFEPHVDFQPTKEAPAPRLLETESNSMIPHKAGLTLKVSKHSYLEKGLDRVIGKAASRRESIQVSHALIRRTMMSKSSDKRSCLIVMQS